MGEPLSVRLDKRAEQLVELICIDSAAARGEIGVVLRTIVTGWLMSQTDVARAFDELFVQVERFRHENYAVGFDAGKRLAAHAAGPEGNSTPKKKVAQKPKRAK